MTRSFRSHPALVAAAVALTAIAVWVTDAVRPVVRRRHAPPRRPRLAGTSGAHDHADHRRVPPLGSRMMGDGRRLVVPDENGLSVIELSADAASGIVVTRVRNPSFRDVTAVARVGNRYLVVNTG